MGSDHVNSEQVTVVEPPFSPPKKQLSGRSLHSIFILALLLLMVIPASADLDILVIGSSRSYSEGGESGSVHEKAFNPTLVADKLRDILDGDAAVGETVNVVVEDIYKNKTLDTALGGGGDIYAFNYRCYSLAQYYMWPEGQDGRLKNLRGENGTNWDYIILMSDPYLLANMPGIYAEGVNLLANEIEKGSAKTVLLAQWPENTSTFSATQFNEIVYRVGRSAHLTVAPSGKAWSSLSPQDTSSQHPTPDGSYLAAASLYSSIFDRNAETSSYSYNDTIANHAFTTVQANASTPQYTGEFSTETAFSMKYVSKRHIQFNETGSSSENGIYNKLKTAMDRCKVTYTRYKAPSTWPAGVAPVDFNLGRGNSWFEAEKQYKIDSNDYDRSYGFPMGDHSDSAAVTMLYGIDKRYYGSGYNDGTDLGIGYDMTRQGEVSSDVRCIPIRMMWAKIHQARPLLEPNRDAWHMSHYLDEASSTFTYTLLSGRCPVGDEPATVDSSDWYLWLGRKIGYETAWRMSHVQTRVPGFKVQPSASSATSVTPSSGETLKVRFMYKPESTVTVTVAVDTPTAAIVSPSVLTFSPDNYSVEQSVSIIGLPGSTTNEDFNVVFTTLSDDEVYNGLGDSWLYTNNRPTSQSLTTVHHGVTSQDLVLDQEASLSLNSGVSNMTPANTTIVGPSHGSITWSGNQPVYTPDSGYLGVDSFAYYVLDGNTLTDGTINLYITPTQLEVKAKGYAILSGDLTPSTQDGTDLGAIEAAGNGTLLQTFTVTNHSATNTLNFTHAPTKVYLEGASAGQFTLTQDLSGSLAPGQSGFFQISFDPSISGIHDATVKIESDASPQSTHFHTIRGIGVGFPGVSIQTPSAISNTSATLEGTLDAGGSAEVTIFWGTTDGGETPAAWEYSQTITVATSAFSVDISNLSSVTTYHYRYLATNAFGESWAGDAATTVTTTSTAPVFTSLVLPPAQLNHSYNVSLINLGILIDTDLPADTLIFTKISGPTWLNLQADGMISGTPGFDALSAGTVSLTVKVDDSYGHSTQAVLSMSISKTDPDLLLWYKLDETSGTTAEDSSGNNYDGSLIGGLSWISGHTNGSIDINAAGRIDIPAAALSGLDAEVTIAFWAKGDIGLSSNSIFMADNSSGDPVMKIRLPLSGKVYWDTGGSSLDRVTKAKAVEDFSGRWTHWAFTKNATNGKQTIYMDGTQIASSSNKTESLSGTIIASLGSETDGDKSYNGVIDDFRIYQRELNSQEVADIHGGPVQFSDWWLTNFSSGQQASIIVSPMEDDPDLDGVPNLIEYAFGTDPHVFQPAPSGNQETLSEISGWSTTFDRFASRADINLYLERSHNLQPGSWQVVAESVAGAAVSAQNGAQVESATGSEPETVKIFVPYAPEETSQFFRWKATNP